MCKLCNLFKKPDTAPIEPAGSGDKYALLVGINRYRPDLDCDLRGCVNDVEHLRTILIEQFNFEPDNIRVVTDERATHNNIIDRLIWLVDHANSELVFQYSGHGSQVRDRDGDELNDGLDEILCPHDINWDLPLTDDYLSEIFKEIPQSSFLTCVIDACHSGSMTRNINNPTGESHRWWEERYLPPPRDIQMRSAGRELQNRKIGTRAIELNHVLLSGCRDDQTSADAYINDTWQGAFTHNLTKHIHPAKTWSDIYSDVLLDVEAGEFSQVPQFNGKKLNERPMFGGA